MNADFVNDVVKGSDENDIIRAGSGDNVVDAGAGDDRISAGAGDDKLDGGAGNDSIVAGAGNDTITGGEGRNSIYAGAGDDTVNITEGDGRASYEVVRGGEGKDTVVFEGNRDDYTVDHDDTNGRFVIENTDTQEVQYIYDDVENIQFADKTVATHDTDGNVNADLANISMDTVDESTISGLVFDGVLDNGNQNVLDVPEMNLQGGYTVNINLQDVSPTANGDWGTIVSEPGGENWLGVNDKGHLEVWDSDNGYAHWMSDDVFSGGELSYTVNADGTFKVSVDGEEIGSGSGLSAPDDATNLAFGENQNSDYSSPLNGTISDVEIVDGDGGVAAHYNFNNVESDGTVHDLSDNGEDAAIDGGDAFVTLVASDNNLNIDLSSIDDDKVSNIDTIDLNGGDNTLVDIKLEDVISLTDDDNILRIEGDNGNTIELNTDKDGQGEWKLGEHQTTDEMTGQTYDVYTNDDSGATLEISTEIHVDES